MLVVLSLNISNSAVRFFLSVAACLVFLFSPTVSSQEAEPDNGSDCKGGTCPFAASGGRVDDYSGNGRNNDGESGCGLWMAPSPIKQAEDHSFGLGIFSGKVRIQYSPLNDTIERTVHPKQNVGGG